MIPAIISVESHEYEENEKTVYKKTVKLFGFSIYKLESCSSIRQHDRPIGFQASPLQPQFVEDDY